jgi:hypothetical protein
MYCSYCCHSKELHEKDIDVLLAHIAALTSRDVGYMAPLAIDAIRERRERERMHVARGCICEHTNASLPAG